MEYCVSLILNQDNTFLLIINKDQESFQRNKLQFKELLNFTNDPNIIGMIKECLIDLVSQAGSIITKTKIIKENTKNNKMLVYQPDSCMPEGYLIRNNLKVNDYVECWNGNNGIFLGYADDPEYGCEMVLDCNGFQRNEHIINVKKIYR